MKKITLLLLAAFAWVSGVVSAQTVDANGIEVSNGENKVYYKIVNNRQKPNNKGYAARDFRGNKLRQLTLEASNTDASAYWYFEKAEGENLYKIGNYATKDALMLRDQNSTFNQNDKDAYWKIMKEGDGVYTISCKGESGNSWNDFQGTGITIDFWAANDPGSKWSFEKVEINTLPELSKIEIKTSTDKERYYYSIKNTRRNKTIRAAESVLNESAEFDVNLPNDLWYFEAVGDGNVYIKNAAFDNNLTEAEGENVHLFGEVPTAWSLVQFPFDDYKATHTFAITKVGKGGTDSWNDFQNNRVCYYDAKDAGSGWVISPVREWKETVDVNGIKVSDPVGRKIYYTLETRRTRLNDGTVLGSYAYAGDSLIQRKAVVDNENCKWYFINVPNAKKPAYEIHNANGSYLNGTPKVKVEGPAQVWELGQSSKEHFWNILVLNSKDKIDARNNVDACGTWSGDEEGTQWRITEIEDLTVTLASIQGNAINAENYSSIATFVAPYPVSLPEGVAAYYVNNADNSSVKLVKYEGQVLPAQMPVVLFSQEAKTAVFNSALSNEVAVSGNLLQGAVYEAATMGDNDYVVAHGAQGITQFYKAKAGSTLGAHKAYLQLAAGASLQSLAFDFTGEATGVEEVELQNNANAPIYDLSGRRVYNAVKGGLYIQNGKKFILK